MAHDHSIHHYNEQVAKAPLLKEQVLEAFFGSRTPDVGERWNRVGFSEVESEGFVAASQLSERGKLAMLLGLLHDITVTAETNVKMIEAFGNATKGLPEK